MVRIDMSEYMEKHSVSRLLGAPPGYVGYDEGGQLTEPVRRRPFSVVLFDEVEKAHPDVFNTLLQVLDEGRLTDGQGRTVDFKNTVLILTSNLGSAQLALIEERESLGVEEKQVLLESTSQAALKAHFRPEFLNRIDEVITFRRLGQGEIRSIVEIQIERLQARLARREVGLLMTESAKDLIAMIGYDPEFGARPLQRTLQKKVENPLAQAVLKGEFPPGSTVKVDAVDDVIHLSSLQTPADVSQFSGPTGRA
jgi:ATP-dependent Clp protease ATP-binding subunit ClpB